MPPGQGVVEGRGFQQLDFRLDAQQLQQGERIGDSNPAVPAGTRPVPLMFGGFGPTAFNRMARWGQGYICGVLATRPGDAFESARTAWKRAGRAGSPNLVAVAYFALGDIDTGRRNVWDYHSSSGKDQADRVAAACLGGTGAVKAAAEAFAGLGADELILNPTLDDIEEVARLADALQPSEHSRS